MASGVPSAARRRLNVPDGQVVAFCRRHHILKMSLFGSILRDDFGSDSDVDVLVEFHPEHIPGLMTLAGIEIEMARLVGGRKVDMHTPGGLSKYLVDRVLAEAEVLHDET